MRQICELVEHRARRGLQRTHRTLKMSISIACVLRESCLRLGWLSGKVGGCSDGVVHVNGLQLLEPHFLYL
jgi:hypothetical protein